MRRCIMGLGFMTLRADGVSFGNQLIAVGVVAVAHTTPACAILLCMKDP